MQQIKIFKVRTAEEKSFADLERTVNAWLSSQKDSIDVHSILPSSFPTAMAITVVYTPK